MSFEYTEHNLKQDETALIVQHATGRALEFGSGMGLGTHALLAGRSSHIMSIDEDAAYTDECAARFLDPRVEWKFHPLDANGWYDDDIVTAILPPGTPPYDTVLLDGPTGYSGRRHCLRMLLDNPLLADGWQLLVTRAALSPIENFIKRWLQKRPIRIEWLPCERGMVRITSE